MFLRLFHQIWSQWILQNSFWKTKITLILNWVRTQQRGKYRLISMMNIDAKILNKCFTICIPENIKKIIHHGWTVSIPGIHVWFNISKKEVWYSTQSELRTKTMLLSSDVPKIFKKIQHPFFHEKVPKETRNLWNIPQYNKGKGMWQTSA